jgi:deoxyribodipyrimidine photo-lyase
VKLKELYHLAIIETSKKPVIVWFRQDLRVQDNDALNAAITSNLPIIPLYIKEEDSEQKWKMGAASSWWLHYSLINLTQELKKIGLKLIIRKGVCKNILKNILEETSAGTLFWNRCYEPASIKRDSEIKLEISEEGVKVKSFNANLLFEPWDIQNKQNKPFQVFTPFWKSCLQNQIKAPAYLKEKIYNSYVHKLHTETIDDLKLLPIITWDAGFKTYWKPGSTHAEIILNDFLKEDVLHYKEKRDRPDIKGVSFLSPYLHFGEISPRMIWQQVTNRFQSDPQVEPYLRQLGWREFAHHLLYHFPETENMPLRKDFLNFPWKNDTNQLKAWQTGMTGYPLVDAGMRQLWQTGWMHNRVRMVVGSFLVKDLLIDWQLGASWFFDTLVDADLANNTLGWQWVAGCGADAAPYFRIFNPTTQAEKFDPDGTYIRKWVPELSSLPTNWIHKPFSAPENVLRSAGVDLGTTYPRPIVDHAKARDLALEALKTKGDFS